MLKYLLTVSVIVLGYSTAGADLGWGGGGINRMRHLTLPPDGTKVVVEASKTADRPRLLIPRNLLSWLRTAALPVDPKQSGALARSLPMLSLGICLAGALTFGGFCMRKWPKRGAGVAALLLIVCLTWPGVLGTASAIPPGATNCFLSGQVQVEVVEEGDAIRLILSKSTPFNYTLTNR